MNKKNKIIILYIIGTIILVSGFWYFKFFTKNTDNSAIIIYKVNYFDQYGAITKIDYHSVNLDGTGDKTIYSSDSSSEISSVLNHKDIFILDVSGKKKYPAKIISKNGDFIEDKYKGIDFGIELLQPSLLYGYSGDGNKIGVIKKTSDNLIEISILDLITGDLKKYICSECKNYHGGYSMSGFSRDGEKLYFNVFRDKADISVDSEPDLKYLYLDIKNEIIKNVGVKYNFGEYYDFYPQYDIAFKRTGLLKSKPGPVYLVNLKDLSEKKLVDDSSGSMIFNGKDAIYNKFSDSNDYYYKPIVKGVNIFSGGQYDILPVNLVNTPKIDEKELLDFLPNDNKFIYKVTYDSGWELRVHDIDTGEDRSILNLTSERFSDKTFYYKQYVGVVF